MGMRIIYGTYGKFLLIQTPYLNSKLEGCFSFRLNIDANKLVRWWYIKPYISSYSLKDTLWIYFTAFNFIASSDRRSVSDAVFSADFASDPLRFKSKHSQWCNNILFTVFNAARPAVTTVLKIHTFCFRYQEFNTSVRWSDDRLDVKLQMAYHDKLWYYLSSQGDHQK